MTKTKYWLSILAISVVLIAGSLAVSPIAIATDDGEDKPLFFRWNPDDRSEDPSNLIAISGSLIQQGLTSNLTTDVQGEFEGLLKADSENNSETTVVTSVGTSTITTTVNAKSQDANDLEGEIQIDGDTFATKLTLLKSKTTTLQVTEEFSGPAGTQTATIEKLTIPVTIEMCNDDDKCFVGFGTIRSETSATSTGVAIITFITNSLETEIIGEDGLFELNLRFFQRIVEPNIKPFEGTVGTAFTINDPFGRLVPSAVVVFTLPGDDVCTQGTTVGDLTVSVDGTSASGTVPASLSAVVHGVTVHDTDQCNASILPFTLQFVVT